jgi:hypothetical protein
MRDQAVEKAKAAAVAALGVTPVAPAARPEPGKLIDQLAALPAAPPGVWPASVEAEFLLRNSASIPARPVQNTFEIPTKKPLIRSVDS